MAYEKTNWVDGTTPVDATNMNKIEDELENLEDEVKENTDLINNLSLNTVGSTWNNLPASIEDLENLTKKYGYGGAFLTTVTNASLISTLTKDDTTQGLRIIGFPMSSASSGYFDYVAFAINADGIYCGRWQNDSMQYVKKCNISSI